MKKKYLIRKTNWNKKDKKGIPYDFIDIMDYFNKDLMSGKYPYVPRKGDPITKSEIKSKWIPDKNKTATYLAEDIASGKIIASTNIPLDTGILAITKDSNFDAKGIGTELTKKVIEGVLSKGHKVIVRTSIKNLPMIKVMEKLGYGKGKLIKNFGVYRDNIEGSNYDVFEWIIKV